MKHVKIKLLAPLGFLLIAIFAGCGNSSQEFVAQGNNNVSPTVGAIRVEQVLLRAVPSIVTRQRFTGFNAQGALAYGPVLVDKAATIDLPNVSTAVTRLQIEYLAGDTVIGLGNVAVVIEAGQTTVVTDPPFDDVTAALESIAVTPAQASIPDGTTQAYSATGTYADGFQADLTSLVTWTSSDTTSATIDANGLATAVAPGNSTITANLGTVSGNASLTVSAATIVSIAVTPNSPSVPDGFDQQFVATATLTDGSEDDVSASATWNSATTATATISNTGLATAVDPGQTVISATVGGVSGSTTLTVTSATLSTLSVEPPLALSAPGSKRQYTATATFSDGSSLDVTSQVAWTSNDLDVVIANDNLGTNKFGRAVVAGNAAVGQTVTLTAGLNGNFATADLILGAFLYSTDLDGDTVTPYTVNTGTGALTAGTSVAAGNEPRSVAIHPNGLFAYVANLTSDTIGVYTINPTNGALTAGTAVVSGDGPSVVTVDPSGRFVYSSNFGDVSIFSVDQTTGALTALPAFDLAGVGTSISLDPTGRFAYICDQAANFLTPLNIDPLTGALSMAPVGAATGTTPFCTAVHPNGRFIFTTNLNSDNVTPLTVAANGDLMAGTNVNAGDGPNFGTVDPSGRFLYTVNINSNNVSVYTIDAGSGALTAGMAVGVGTGPRGVTVDPSGRFVYTANRGSNNVSQLTINQTTGALTFGANTAAGTGPFSVAHTP